MKYDIFAIQYDLKIYKENRLSSYLGLSLTAIIVIIGIAIAVTQGQDLIKRKNPKVNRNVNYEFAPDLYNLLEGEFAFSFKFDGDIIKLIDPSYINFGIFQYLKTTFIDENNEKINKDVRIKLDWEFCDENSENWSRYYNILSKSTKENIDEIFKVMGYNSHICLKNYNLTIGGEYNTDYFSNFYVEISKCINSSKITCKEDNEINSLVSSKNFIFYYTNQRIDSNNYTHPMYSFVDTYHFKLEPFFFYNTDLYISRQNVISDTGLVFEDFKTKKGWYFENFREIINLSSLARSNRLVRLYIGLGSNEIVEKIYYMKIQDLAALVGGIVEALYIIASFLNNFLNEYKFDILLINHLFKEDKNEMSRKSVITTNCLEFKGENVDVDKDKDIGNTDHYHPHLKLKEFSLKPRMSIWTTNLIKRSKNSESKIDLKKGSIEIDSKEDDNNSNLKQIESHKNSDLNVRNENISNSGVICEEEIISSDPNNPNLLDLKHDFLNFKVFNTESNLIPLNSSKIVLKENIDGNISCNNTKNCKVNNNINDNNVKNKHELNVNKKYLTERRNQTITVINKENFEVSKLNHYQDQDNDQYIPRSNINSKFYNSTFQSQVIKPILKKEEFDNNNVCKIIDKNLNDDSYYKNKNVLSNKDLRFGNVNIPNQSEVNYQVNNEDRKVNLSELNIGVNEPIEISKNERNNGTNLKENNKDEDLLDLNYFDVISFKLLFCFTRFKNKKLKFENYREQLYSNTDYSDVLKEIISFKEFKKNMLDT